MERTDEGLMEAYREGDVTAFPDLVCRYQGLLLGYLMRMVHNRETAEDCFQETFLRVHSKAHTYRPGHTFKSWLFTIATRVAIDRLRRLDRRPEAELTGAEEADSACSPVEQASQAELRATVKRAIDTLPPKQRAALILSYYQGYTYAETADIMNCSLGTVKTHMARALKTLGERLPRPEGGRL